MALLESFQCLPVWRVPKGGEEDFHGQTLAGTNVLYTESWQEGSQEHTDFGYMPCLGDDYQGSG